MRKVNIKLLDTMNGMQTIKGVLDGRRTPGGVSGLLRSLPCLCRTTICRAVACLAAVLLLAGCSKEPVELPVGSDDVLTGITLSTESMGETTMNTRSVSCVDENTVSDLWVIQLDEAGTAVLSGPRYFSGSEVAASGGKYTVDMKIKAQPSRLYFIANTGDPSLFVDAMTSALVESKTMTVRAEADLAPNGVLPMCGYFSGTPTVSSLANVALKRAAAKLTFKLAADMPANCSFTLTGVELHNVPQTMQYFRDPSKLDPGTDADLCYPAASAGFTDLWMDMTPDDKTLTAAAKECGWCYLPENARGRGTAAAQTDKTAATALGGAAGQGDYASYIEITGDYVSDLGYKYTGNKYRIYLGGDAVSDYNVLRNTHYTVTAAIRGLNRVDARITLGSETIVPVSGFYDYTDNLTGRFVYAESDLVDGATETWNWVDAKNECGKIPGWRLPSIKELRIICCMGAFEGNKDNYYWAGTISFQISSYSWIQNHRYGSNTRSQNNLCSVRCVRELFQPPDDADVVRKKQYPYVQDGTIIVCREGEDGVKPSLIHEKWTVTPPHDEQDAENKRFAAKFEVASALAVAKDGKSSNMTWYEAAGEYDATYNPDNYAACASYSQTSDDAGQWRLPTLQELRLIYALNDELINAPNERFWSATSEYGDNTRIWSELFATEYQSRSTDLDSKVRTINVLCIRDLE